MSPNALSTSIKDRVLTYTNPTRANDCVEGGWTLQFNNKSRILYLEIYNDGEIGFISMDGANILDNRQILESEIADVINSFLNSTGSI